MAAKKRTTTTKAAPKKTAARKAPDTAPAKAPDTAPVKAPVKSSKTSARPDTAPVKAPVKTPASTDPAPRPMLTAGDRAPDLTLLADDDRPVSLASLRGKNVVLYFYPKDSTPGCTLEGQEFSRLAPKFAAKEAVVFGVSADGTASHRRFKEKCAIGIPLLADPEKRAIQAFGVWQEKSMYGRKMMGIVRSTFLIGPDGKLRRVWPKVKVADHAAEVLAAI